MNLDLVIRKKLRIKNRDSLPLTGFFRQAARLHIAQIMAEAGFKLGAEIGVQRGYHAQVLLNTIPDLKLLGIDPWHAYNRVSQKHADMRYEACQKRLKSLNVEYLRMTSMEALKEVEDGSLDFVYIDGLHEFDPVIMDIISWEKKVRKGGIVAGHDYVEFFQGGVISAVQAYTQAHVITDWYVTREKIPSWFWVKK